LSQEWYLIKPPRIYNSGFENDEFNDYAQDGFDELLLTSPLSKVITIFYNTIASDGFKTEAIIQNVTTDNVNNSGIRQILCKIGTLKAGQYVEYKGRYWLIVSLPDDNKMYEKAIMMCCNHYLHWINDNGEIIGRHCIVEDGTKYSVGEKSNNVTNIILGDTRINLRIPRDDETLQFKNGKRFLISNTSNNPTAYKLTIFDDVTDYFGSNGIINLICVETRFNPQTDNVDLMIADYYNPESDISLELLNYDINSPVHIKTNERVWLDILAINNGQPVKYNDIIFTSLDTSIVTVDTEGYVYGISEGVTQISIEYKSLKIDMNIVVITAGIDDVYYISILDDDNDTDILYGETNTVRVLIFKNGIEIMRPYECELIGSENIAKIENINENNLKIKALNNSKNINKSFTLRVWNQELNIESSLQFKVVGYF
jgi:hypothetical protein